MAKLDFLLIQYENGPGYQITFIKQTDDGKLKYRCHQFNYVDSDSDEWIYTDIDAESWTNKLERLLMSWKPDYVDLSVIDGWRYRIDCRIDDSYAQCFDMCNMLPKNFDKFNDLIRMLKKDF